MTSRITHSRSPRRPLHAENGDDPEFERQAEQAEEEAALDKEVDDTFPTSDPPSSWAGEDPERQQRDTGPK